VNKARRKPIICNLMTDKRQWAETANILKKGEVPSYSFPTTAAKALVALTQYHKIRTREIGQVRRFNDVNQERAAAVLREANEAGRDVLLAAEVYDILAAYGIPAADWRMAGSADEAVQAAADIGFPVVVKADSETIVHKSDAGGVAVNLQDGDAVRAAVEEMAGRLSAQDLRFFIQKYLPGGREVIVGAKAEKGLGHLIMFGIGGIYVETLKDVVFKLTPITTVEAEEMLSSIQGAPLLKGVRGEKGVDEEGIMAVIQRLSQLVTDLPMIQEMDLNPIIAYEDRVSVVDARILLASSWQ
jgi:acyl-CoA synthetase (NDP forming)